MQTLLELPLVVIRKTQESNILSKQPRQWTPSFVKEALTVVSCGAAIHM